MKHPVNPALRLRTDPKRPLRRRGEAIFARQDARASRVGVLERPLHNWGNLVVNYDAVIRFHCTCGQSLEVGPVLAGQAVQCPRCKRLTDVPTPEEAKAILEDGTLQLAPRVTPPPPLPPRRRPHALQYAGVTTPKAPAYLPPQLSHANAFVAPLAEPNRSPAQTAPRKPTLRYSLTLDDERRPFLSLPLELLRPANAIVMGIVCIGLLIVPLFALLAFGGAFPLAAFGIVLLLIVVAHYVSVIDETGPEARDELPPPLREVSFWDDFWRPLMQLAFALALCFGPTVWLFAASGWRTDRVAAVAGAAWAAIAFPFFPAVLLTVVTGTTPLNLSPHRLVRVMAVCGVPYLFATFVLLPAAVVLHALAALFFAEAVSAAYDLSILRPAATPVSPWLTLPAGGAMLVLAVYVGHLFPWWLGRLYRRHHDQFPWLLQRHERREPERSVPVAAVT